MKKDDLKVCLIRLKCLFLFSFQMHWDILSCIFFNILQTNIHTILIFGSLHRTIYKIQAKLKARKTKKLLLHFQTIFNLFVVFHFHIIFELVHGANRRSARFYLWIRFFKTFLFSLMRFGMNQRDDIEYFLFFSLLFFFVCTCSSHTFSLFSFIFVELENILLNRYYSRHFLIFSFPIFTIIFCHSIFALLLYWHGELTAVGMNLLNVHFAYIWTVFFFSFVPRLFPMFRN